MGKVGEGRGGRGEGEGKGKRLCLVMIFTAVDGGERQAKDQTLLAERELRNPSQKWDGKVLIIEAW